MPASSPLLCRLLGVWLVAALLCLGTAAFSCAGAAARPPRQQKSHRRCRRGHGKHRKKCRARKKKKVAKQKAPAGPLPTAGPAAPSTPAPAAEEPGLEPPPPLSQVAPSSIEQVPDSGDSTLVVDGSHSYGPGEFLTAPPSSEVPEGFLVKVVSSSVSGGATEVITEPASFFEAVPNGEIAENLSESDAAVPLNAAARRIEASASGISQLFSKHVSCTDGAQAELSGSLEGGLEPRLELKWHKRFGIPTGIDKARVALEAGIEAEVSASVSAKGSCTLSPVTLFTPKWEVPVDVGPVVVPVKVEIPVSLIASAQVEGKVSVSAEADVHGAIGAAYEDGGIHGVHEFSTGHGLTHSVSASAKLRVGLSPEVKVKAGWSVPVLGTLGAELDSGITAGPELNYKATGKPPGSYCAFLDLNSTVALDLPHESPLKAGPHTWYDGDLSCVHFGPEAPEGAEGAGEPEIKGETGEKELGEREGKDGERAFEEAREAEERRIEEQVELIEEEEELEREKERAKRQAAELKYIEEPGEGAIRWTGELRASYSEVESFSYESGGTFRFERHNTGTWYVDGYSPENRAEPDAEGGSGYPGTDHSEVTEKVFENRSFPSCAREGYSTESFAHADDEEGDATPIAFRYNEGLPEFSGVILGVYLRHEKQAVWGCPSGSSGVEESSFSEDYAAPSNPEEANLHLVDGGGCLHHGGPNQAELVGPGEVFVNEHETVESGGYVYTCSIVAELTARCREPGKPQSAWPAPNSNLECPDAAKTH